MKRKYHPLLDSLTISKGAYHSSSEIMYFKKMVEKMPLVYRSRFADEYHLGKNLHEGPEEVGKKSATTLRDHSIFRSLVHKWE